MCRVLVFAIAFCLSGSPTLAQSLHNEPTTIVPTLLDSARAEAAKFGAAQAGQPSDDYRPGGMQPGYFWTAIGLMGAGGVYLATGAFLNSSDVCDDLDVDCGGIGTAVVVLGAGLIGTGALVYLIGKNKARAAGSPQIVATPRGIAVRSRISF